MVAVKLAAPSVRRRRGVGVEVGSVKVAT